MADATLDDQAFVLFDNWPGSAEPRTIPYDSFLTSAARHNVTTADYYSVGAKIEVDCPGTNGSAGKATFIYLLLAPTEANPTPAAKQLVVPVSATNIYTVTNDPDACLMHTGCPLAAVMLSVMSSDGTTDYYGWFWCGGVCPVDFVSDLGGNFATDDSVAIGPITTQNLTADAIGLGGRATTEGGIGFALAAD